ncbi:MAG: hypothetical protein AAGA27_05890, partial [Pseudomonadota bacterium]
MTRHIKILNELINTFNVNHNIAYKISLEIHKSVTSGKKTVYFFGEVDHELGDGRSLLFAVISCLVRSFPESAKKIWIGHELIMPLINNKIPSNEEIKKQILKLKQKVLLSRNDYHHMLFSLANICVSNELNLEYYESYNTIKYHYGKKLAGHENSIKWLYDLATKENIKNFTKFKFKKLMCKFAQNKHEDNLKMNLYLYLRMLSLNNHTASVCYEKWEKHNCLVIFNGMLHLFPIKYSDTQNFLTMSIHDKITQSPQQIIHQNRLFYKLTPRIETYITLPENYHSLNTKLDYKKVRCFN